jgi:radical SAM superfamily enzyme YgiQ (UPF0313 family)
MVMTGGMFNQQLDALRLIALAHQHGKPAVVGGPDATSSPHIYEAADFRVLGEVEDVIARFIAVWNAGERGGCFTAEKFQIDVSTTPAPRFDLLKFDQYMYIGLQYSRSCPFTCEFCDIIELYGRVPRTKTPPQMLAELQRLYDLGYRGHVDFVDDNLIATGNRCGFSCRSWSLGRRRTTTRLSSPPKHQSISPTITICCSLCARRTSSPYSSA